MSKKSDTSIQKFKIKYNQLIQMSARVWEVYSLMAPLAFILIAGCLYALELSSWESILYSALTIGATTIIMWWYWAIWTIRKLGNTMESANKAILDVKKELKAARKDFKQMPFDR